MRHNFSLADQHAITKAGSGKTLPSRKIIPDGKVIQVSFVMMDAMQRETLKGAAMNDIAAMDAETMILDAAPADDRAQITTLLAQATSGSPATSASAIDNLNSLVRSYAGRAHQAQDQAEKQAWGVAVDRLSGAIAGLQAKGNPLPAPTRDARVSLPDNQRKPMTDAEAAHDTMVGRLNDGWRN